MKLCLLSIIFLFAICLLVANEDPRGDVYPSVKVKGNEFHIFFHNTIDNKDYEAVFVVEDNTVGRMQTKKVIDSSLTGEKIESNTKPDNAVEFISTIRAITSSSSTFFLRFGKLRKDGIETEIPCLSVIPGFVMNNELAALACRTISPAVEKDIYNKAKEFEFKEDSLNINHIKDGWADEKLAVFAVATNEKKLYLCFYSGNEYKDRKIVELGVTAYSGFYPVVSNLVLHNDSFFMSFVEFNQANSNFRLILSRIDKKTFSLKNIVLEENVDPETALSIGAIMNKLLIARHSTLPDENNKDLVPRLSIYFPTSMILTIFHDIEKE